MLIKQTQECQRELNIKLKAVIVISSQMERLMFKTCSYHQDVCLLFVWGLNGLNNISTYGFSLDLITLINVGWCEASTFCYFPTNYRLKTCLNLVRCVIVSFAFNLFTFFIYSYTFYFEFWSLFLLFMVALKCKT